MKRSVYGFYEDDKLIAKGTTRELAEQFDVDQVYITTYANQGRKLLGRYKVIKFSEFREDEESKRLNDQIKELWSKGMRQKQIAQKLRVTPATVNGRVRAMRERGEL